jgi:hypothetical protein
MYFPVDCSILAIYKFYGAENNDRFENEDDALFNDGSACWGSAGPGQLDRLPE